MKRAIGIERRPAAAAFCILLWSAAGAATELRAQAAEPIKYRQIFVPKAELDRQIRGLLPLAREEFDRRLARIRQNGNRQTVNAARIERAAYKARWDGLAVLAGSAELEVRSDAPGPTVLPLGNLRLALHDATWAGTPPRTAVIGSDPAGATSCLVEGSGTMQWNWSLRGSTLAGRRTQFALQFPPATISSLLLELPAGHSLEVEGGIASPLANLAAKTANQPPGQTWLVEIGGPGAVTLRMNPVAESGLPQPIVTVRESSTYALLRSAVDLEMSLDIDSFQQRLPNLTLRVERPLEITSIRLGERALEWFVAASDERLLTVTVPLNDPLPSPAVTLTVQAVAPWSTEEPAALPRVTLQSAVYQEGRATIAAPAWLRMHARPVRGCWQAGVLPASTPSASDQMQFRLHAADAAIEVGANLAPAGLREASGTQLVIDATQVTAAMTAELTSLGGNRFFVEARIPRRWIIDSVEVQPADALSDRLLAAATPDQQLLRLNLKRAIQESLPLRVIIRGHHRRPADNGNLPEDFLRLATFSDVRSARRLVAVRSVEPGVEFHAEDEERLTRLDPAKLPEEEMKLFDAAPGTLLFAADEDAIAAKATLTAAAPAYRTEAQSDVYVAPRQVRQSLKLRVIPESSPVGRVVVQLMPKPPGQVTWSLAGADALELDVKLLSPEVSSEEGARYQLNILRPRSVPFEIVADWASPNVRRHPISVALAPEAAGQTGLARLHSIDAVPLVVDAAGVQSLPLPPVPDGQFSTLRGIYAYSPGVSPAMSVVTLSPAATMPAGWIESLQVRSHFSSSGDAVHEATFDVVNQGLTQLALRLPSSALELSHVDSESGELSALPRTSDGRFVVPLPPGKKNTTLHLRYLSSQPPSWGFPSRLLEAPVPEADLPMLARTWNVALGPGLLTTHDRGGSPLISSALSPFWNPVSDDRAGWASARQPRPSFLAALSAPSAPLSHRGDEAGENARPSESDLVGWRVYDLEMPPGSFASIRVYQPAAASAAGVAVFLLTLGGALTLGRRQPTWLAVAASIGLLLTALASPEWMPLVGGFSMGLIVALAAWLLRSRSPAAVHERSTAAARRRILLMTLLALPLACYCVAQAMADDGPAQPKDGQATPAADHRVVIAIDDQQLPTGDYVFLSPEFYERLHRLSDTPQSELPAWLLASANYLLPAAPQLEGPAPSIDEITAQFDLETFSADAVIGLPFDRKQIHLLEGRSKLDGEAIVPAWSDDGSVLRIVVPSSGRHRLEMSFGAPAKSTGDAIVLDLGIPAAAHAVVTTPPSSQSPPAIVSAQGGELAAPPSDSRQTALGPARRLTIHWALADKPAPARIEVDQMIWWKLRPGSVIARGRFRFRPIGGPQERVRIEFDSRLRLVPGSIVPAPAHLKIEEGPRHTAELTLAEKADGEFTLEATWQWTGASAAGNLSLPLVSAPADRTTRSWTAVSVDPALAFSQQPPSSGSIAPEDFLIAWNEPDTSPDAAFDDLAAPGPRSFTLVPAGAQPAAETIANWSASARRARVEFEARLTSVPDIRFHHLLDMPPSLKVTRVELTSGGAPLAHRWTQQPDGSLVVTLLDKPPREQTLVVEGNVGLVRNRPRLPLPLIDIREADTTSRQLRIYRAADIRVRLLDATGWKAGSPPELGHHVDGRGRLVAQLDRAAGAQPSEPNLAVSMYRPQVSGRLAWRVAGVSGQWSCEADLDLQVDRGVLDHVRLEVPAEWSGPFEIEPAAEHRIVALPGGARQQVVIWPQQAAGDTLRLSLRSPLRNVGGQPLRAPNIAIHGAPQVERVIALDTGLAARPVVWKTRGLQFVEPDSVSLPERWPTGGYEVCRVVDEEFDATPTLPTRAHSQPQVTLADISVAQSTGRRLVGRAVFYVEPADAGELTLDMPRGLRLVHVSIDGVPAQCSADGLRSWRIEFDSQGLPVAVEALFEGALPASASTAGGTRIAAPRLRGLAVQRTLWSFDNLRHVPAADRKIAPRAAGQLEAKLVRLETFARCLNRVADFPTSDLPPAALGQVYRGWRRQYHVAQNSLETQIPQGSAAATDFVERLREARQTAADADRRMIQSGVELTPDSTLASVDRPSGQTFFSAEGWQEGVAVRAPFAASPDEFPWAFAAGAMVLMAVTWSLGRSRAGRDRMAALAPTFLALGGLAWWLLAPWAWLGWLAVAAAVWLAVRSPWNTRHSWPGTRDWARSG
jgi:hypothetical protein